MATTLLFLGSALLVACDAVSRDDKAGNRLMMEDDRLSDGYAKNGYDEVLTERAVVKRGNRRRLLEFCGAVLSVLKAWGASLEVEFLRQTASVITTASATLGEGCSLSASLGPVAPKKGPAWTAASSSSRVLDVLG